VQGIAEGEKVERNRGDVIRDSPRAQEKARVADEASILKKMLKERGYSDKAIKAILEWYERSP